MAHSDCYLHVMLADVCCSTSKARTRCIWQCMEHESFLCCKSACCCGAQNVLVAGWGDQNFMIALLHSMDQELPKDSRVTLLNLRPKEQVLGGRPQRPGTTACHTAEPALMEPHSCQCYICPTVCGKIPCLHIPQQQSFHAQPRSCWG